VDNAENALIIVSNALPWIITIVLLVMMDTLNSKENVIQNAQLVLMVIKENAYHVTNLALHAMDQLNAFNVNSL
jgi:MFS-type transporter involved in bile tolerance (Atg22 family)